MHLNTDTWDLLIFGVGWSLGWLLLWSPRPLPRTPAEHGSARDGVAVVIPARDEVDALPHLLPPLVRQRGTQDEIIVVDDHSNDGTADAAAHLGARVVSPPPLPAGWLGKPHACWLGARASTAPILLFVDADVTPAPDLLDRIAAEVTAHPGQVVSVQPWHQTGGFAEQASILCNVTALMGCGAFTIAGRSVGPTVAFGPVLAMARDTYLAVGGHADVAVRTMHTEDIGLARAVGRVRLFTGRPDTSFRMYPGGLAETIRGWSRSFATGARFSRWWSTLAAVLWMSSLIGGWMATPLVYPLCAVQVWVLGRRAGSIHPLTAILFPLALVFFLVIFVRSAFAVVFGRRIEWKGRRVEAR